MSRGTHHFTTALRERIPRNSRLLLAVSGGVDSMALLHGLVALSRERGYRIEVAHVDHRLRQESSEDSAFVRRCCKTLEVTFHHLKASKPGKGQNIEAWGRQVRYEFFERVRKRRKLDFIVTAHQADDLAETFLMRLLSNKEPNPILAHDPKRRLLRPLLQVTRSEVVRFAKDRGIAWREDGSNLDQRFLRNKVRHSLLPFLAREFDARIVEVLSERCLAIAEDSAFLYSLAVEAQTVLRKLRFGSVTWLKELKKLSLAEGQPIRWRLIEEILLPKLGFRVGRKKGGEIALVVSGERLGMELPGSFLVRRTKGRLVFARVRKRGSISRARTSKI